MASLFGLNPYAGFFGTEQSFGAHYEQNPDPASSASPS